MSDQAISQSAKDAAAKIGLMSTWREAKVGAIIQQAIDAATTEERELRIMQLAAISTASIQNTEASVKDRIGPENPYCSTAYLDVCRAVDREMKLIAWQDSMLAVRLDHQAIGTALGFTLGTDVRTANVVERIQAMAAEIEQLKQKPTS